MRLATMAARSEATSMLYARHALVLSFTIEHPSRTWLKLQGVFLDRRLFRQKKFIDRGIGFFQQGPKLPHSSILCCL